MLIEIEREFKDENRYKSGSLYVNPENVMTLETEIRFLQDDLVGEKFNALLYLILNGQDFFISKKLVTRNELKDVDKMIEYFKHYLRQIEELKDYISDKPEEISSIKITS